MLLPVLCHAHCLGWAAWRFKAQPWLAAEPSTLSIALHVRVMAGCNHVKSLPGLGRCASWQAAIS